jgi:neutral ceramidase
MSNQPAYRIGRSMRLIDIPPRGLAMHGYGKPDHKATGQQTPLHARSLYVEDAQGKALWFCCLDLGYVTQAMREGVCEVLRDKAGADFDDARLVLTCTHTHSGPGGCTHDVLYNLVTPGFQPEHLAKVVEAASQSLLEAQREAEPAGLELHQGRLEDHIPVAWNRSIKAYNRNPDVEPQPDTRTEKALDRTMSVLAVRQQDRITALLSLFGVHATCLSNRLNRHDGDNKGYAARHAEDALQANGSEQPVAIFAQGTAGDVSPHQQGPGAYKRRRALKGEAEYTYARQNGERQSRFALGLLQQPPSQAVSGSIDAVFSYVDFTDLHADPQYANGHDDAYTSEPCHGVAFFTGAPVDGRGMPIPLAKIAASMARRVKKQRLAKLETYEPQERRYLERLYAAQGPKDILMESGRKRILGKPFHKLPLPGFPDPLVAELKRQVEAGAVDQSNMVPTVLPLQIITLGDLAIVCCPGEFTTVAGQRVKDTVAEKLASAGIRQVLICTYCNDYMGYVTTREEYQEQAYEGGHTIYGQWTLAAFQTEFSKLAEQLTLRPEERDYDRETRPGKVPAGELALRGGTTT